MVSTAPSSSYLELSARHSHSVNLAGNKVWYDEANECLILVRHNEFRCVDLSSSTATTSFKYDGAALDVKLSRSREFVAVQRSETDVSVLHPGTRKEWRFQCQKKGNAVLRGGVVWISMKSNSFAWKDLGVMLVTRFGPEIYSIPDASTVTENPTMAPRTVALLAAHHSSSHMINSFWVFPTKNLLLYSTTNEAGKEMRLIETLEEDPSQQQQQQPPPSSSSSSWFPSLSSSSSTTKLSSPPPPARFLEASKDAQVHPRRGAQPPRRGRGRAVRIRLRDPRPARMVGAL